MKILKMVFEVHVKYCEVSKESNFHIANGTATYNPCTLSQYFGIHKEIPSFSERENL
jgi:hypothetical protein